MIYMAFLILTVAILAFAFYEWQYYMVFSPTYKRDEALSASCSIISLVTADGVKLEGTVCESPNATNTLLAFVGRGHDAVGLINKLSSAYPNTRVVTFNYRSYGKSEGKANEKNLLKDSLQIAEFVQKNYGDFYLLGFSLGSNVAAYVASIHRAKAIFLVGAFDSLAALAKTKFVDRSFFPMIDLSKMFRCKFRTSDYVKKIDVDTYLFVSKSDETTYIENSRDLKLSVKNLTYYTELENLTHKELLWSDAVMNKINEVVR